MVRAKAKKFLGQNISPHRVVERHLLGGSNFALNETNANHLLSTKLTLYTEVGSGLQEYAQHSTPFCALFSSAMERSLLCQVSFVLSVLPLRDFKVVSSEMKLGNPTSHSFCSAYLGFQSDMQTFQNHLFSKKIMVSKHLTEEGGFVLVFQMLYTGLPIE